MWSSWPWVSTIAVDVVEPVPDVVEVGEDQVDAGLVVLGEEHAAVDDEQPAGVLEDRHVAADLAEPAERDDAQAALGAARAAVRARGAGGSRRGPAGREGRRAAGSTSSSVAATQRRPDGALRQHAEQLQRGLGQDRALGDGHDRAYDRDAAGGGSRAPRRGRRASTAATIAA